MPCNDAEKIFPPQYIAGRDLLKSEVEKRNVFEKLDSILALRGKDKLNRGVTPFQAVKMLGLLRNRLTHFKPEWSHEAERHKAVSQSCEGCSHSIHGSVARWPFRAAGSVTAVRFGR